MAELHVELVAADRKVWSGEATIVVARTTDGDTGIPAELGAAPAVRRLKLPPLSPAEVESLVASMLVLPAPERHTLASRLHDEGGGNPLYTIELAAALVESEPSYMWLCSDAIRKSSCLPLA